METVPVPDLIPWESEEGLAFLTDLETVARACGDDELAKVYRQAAERVRDHLWREAAQ
jgi:hypothetical protein